MARKKAFGKDSAVQKSKVLRRGLDAHCSFRRISDDQESHGTHWRKELCGSGLSIRQTRYLGELDEVAHPSSPRPPILYRSPILLRSPRARRAHKEMPGAVTLSWLSAQTKTARPTELTLPITLMT